jgi:hypothetical protein
LCLPCLSIVHRQTLGHHFSILIFCWDAHALKYSSRTAWSPSEPRSNMRCTYVSRIFSLHWVTFNSIAWRAGLTNWCCCSRSCLSLTLGQQCTFVQLTVVLQVVSPLEVNRLTLVPHLPFGDQTHAHSESRRSL